MFPNDYNFYVRVTPAGDTRIPQVTQFLNLLREAFEFEDWDERCPGQVTEDFVDAELNKNWTEKEKRRNLPAGLAIASDGLNVRVMLTTGERPAPRAVGDSFNVMFNGDFRKPEPRYWLKAIELLLPYRADLSFTANKFEIGPQERMHRFGPYKPAACFGLDYYTEPVLTNLGGRSHVLKTPAHCVTEFCDGVLIELVSGYYFDPKNPAHREIQVAAMRHLGIDK